MCEWIGKHVRADNAVLDGELACLDEEGKPQFNRLLRRRGDPVFVAFDLLWLNGRDLRGRPLLDRKAALRALIRNGSLARRRVHVGHTKAAVDVRPLNIDREPDFAVLIDFHRPPVHRGSPTRDGRRHPTGYGTVSTVF